MKDFGKSHVLPSFFPFRENVKSWRTSHHQMLLTMKLTIILMTVALLHVHAGVFSQNVTISGRNLSLKKIFKVIESQTGYAFFYKNELLENAKPVTLDVKNAPLESVLQLCFADQPLGYDIQNKTVFITAPNAQTVTLSEKDAPLEKVLQEIKKQTGYDFVFTQKQLEGTSPVSIQVNKASLEEVLDICFKDQPFSYSIINKTIVVKQKEKPFAVAPIVPPPAFINVNGRVVNEKGDPVAGVTVTVKNTKIATATNDNGEFNLTILDANVILVFSATSIETLETKIDRNTTLKISLKTKINKLDEVQVIAYGATTKRFNAGNVSSVYGEDIAKQPVSNPLAALEGRIPGVFITQQTGLSGGGFTVQIHGQNSLRNKALIPSVIEGNLPLYVIDGVPYTSSSLQTISSANGNSDLGSGMSPLNYINPADIESIDILKDADATSIYGSRGANGVILITTKKGKAGKTKLDINLYSGIGSVTRMQSLLNRRQYLDMRYEALKNNGALPGSTNPDDDLLTWDTTRYTNWQKDLIGGVSKYNDAQASFSGGNSYTQFLFGGGFHKETTVFPGEFYDQKASVHFNLNHTSENKKFKVSFIANYVNDDNHLLRYDITAYSQITAPDAPSVFDSTNKLNWIGNFDNPYSQLLQTSNAVTSNLISNSIFSYEIFPGLKFRANLGYNLIQLNEYQSSPIASLNPIYGITTGQANFDYTTVNNWIIEPQLLYAKTIKQSQLDVLVGSTYQENSQKTTTLAGTGYTSDNLLNSISLASNVSAGANNALFHYNALFGRIKYMYRDKYIINLTGRKDGSSRFGSGKQFAQFGSVGGAWIFSNEKFLKNIYPLLSFGKLRMSYGTSGNDQIGDYGYLSSYTSTYYAYQGLIGLRPTRLSNINYGWEINRKLEAGIELGFLKDRILVTTSFYRNRSSNQLVGQPLSLVTGFSSVQSNYPALVENTGIEIELNTLNIKLKDFSWTSNFTITIPKNKLISFPGIESTAYNTYYTVGKSLNIFKGLHFLGVDQSTGKYQFLDKNGKPTFSPLYPDDFIYTAFKGQIYYGGLQNTIKFKEFQFDFFIQFVKQTGTNNLSNDLPGLATNQPVAVLDRWRKPGDNVAFQPYNQDYSLYTPWINTIQSDQTISDASYVRLKNVSFSYQLPSKWLSKCHMQFSRIYFQGQNLFTRTSYKGLDPENQSTGALPPLKVISAGIQLTL